MANSEHIFITYLLPGLYTTDIDDGQKLGNKGHVGNYRKYFKKLIKYKSEKKISYWY